MCIATDFSLDRPAMLVLTNTVMISKNAVTLKPPHKNNKPSRNMFYREVAEL